jgi:hypothetical protein
MNGQFLRVSVIACATANSWRFWRGTGMDCLMVVEEIK